MRLPLPSRYPVAIALAMALLIALVVVGTRSYGQMRNELAALERTHQLQDAVSDLTITLLEAKTHQRRYLLTQESDVLDQFHALGPKVDAALERLGRLAPVAEMPALRGGVGVFSAELAESMAAARSGGLDAALLLLRSEHGNGRLDTVQTVLRHLYRDAELRLADQQIAAAASVQRNQRLASALMAGLAALLLTSFMLMRAAIHARAQAHAADRRALELLEKRVRAGTRELAETELKLEASRAHLRGVFDSSIEGILSVDRSQTVVMANAAAAKTFGHPLDRLIGMPLDRLIPERYRTQHRTDVQSFADARAASRPMGRRARVHGLRADGTEFPLEASISSVHVDGEEFHTAVLRDITERLRAEEQLQASETRLRRLFALLPEAVFVNSQGRIAYANEAAQRLFGVDEAGLLGRDPLTLIHPDSKPLVQERIVALQGGQAFAPLAEIKIQREDGTPRWVESTAATMEDDGRRSIVVVLRDVSELRSMRGELAASHADLRRLMSAQTEVQEKERARIARELHDDLQQSLAAIKMDLAAATQSASEAPAEVVPLLANARALADTVIVSTRRIVNDLRPQLLDDLGLAAALQSLASQFAQRTGIDCEVDDRANGAISDLSPAGALCLFRVAQEALNNVAKHAGAHDVCLTLRVAEPGWFALQVDDDGRGIADSDRGKAGSYGLPGMRERVESLGGTLTVTARSEGGTRVAVTVPASPAPEGGRPPA